MKREQTPKQIRKRRARRLLFVAAILLLVYGLFAAYRYADRRYREEKQIWYQAKAQRVEQAQAVEKQWLHQNVGESGVIFLNNTNTAEDVNPYFSCQAALGLLAGNPTEEDLQVVKLYLNWHTRQIINYDGVVSNYHTTEGELLPTGKYDSVDAYLGVYLILLGNYVEKGGDLTDVSDWEMSVTVCAEELEKLTQNGLTRVSEQNGVAYLMDNLEVWEGCKVIENLLLSENEEVNRWKQAEEMGSFFGDFAAQLFTSMEAQLWNEEEQRYEIGLDEEDEILNFPGWEDFYPGAIAQVYSVACGKIPEERDILLYETLCETFSWEYLELDGGTFEWPVLAYIGASFGDEERTETYIETFEETYGENRKYPFHTATAGWLSRACDRLLLLYQERAESTLLEDFLKRNGIV